MFDITLKNILANIWPMVVITTIILSSLRIAYLIKYKEKFIYYEEMLKLGFMIYIISLFYVVTFQDVSWSTSNFIPFKEIFRYQLFSPSFIKNVVGNLIMFMPYGFFISYFLKLDKKRYAVFMSFLISVTIELTQLIIGRVFDVDDILLNVIGGFLGYLVYRLLHNFKEKLPNFLKNNIFYNILVTFLLFLIVCYILNILGVVV
ncbi:MAG: VanZ family protein [Bacilli bacterium]|nr:VanZ family protein [Bacilli bacterium]